MAPGNRVPCLGQRRPGHWACQPSARCLGVSPPLTPGTAHRQDRGHLQTELLAGLPSLQDRSHRPARTGPPLGDAEGQRAGPTGRLGWCWPSWEPAGAQRASKATLIPFGTGVVLGVGGSFLFLKYKSRAVCCPHPLEVVGRRVGVSRGGRAAPGTGPEWAWWPGRVTARQLRGSGICASTPPGSSGTICERCRSGPSGSTSC